MGTKVEARLPDAAENIDPARAGARDTDDYESALRDTGLAKSTMGGTLRVPWESWIARSPGRDECARARRRLREPRFDAASAKGWESLSR